MASKLLTALNKAREEMKEDKKKELAVISERAPTASYYDKRDLEEVEFYQIISAPFRFGSYFFKSFR
jgi:hypothetical protein